MNLYDTISAISTPMGEGGISVIRVSGENTFAVIEKIFFKDNLMKKKFTFADESTHTIHFGYIFDNKNKNLTDEVLISIFKNPNSYTGEDVVEISSHGGSFITQKILNILLQNNIRHAEPGEFTKRAFLNGRIDLSQAEAVADLIKAKTDSAHSSSIKQLEGSLSEFVKKTQQDIINIVSLVELELDFAEEGLEFVKKDEIKLKVETLNSKLEKIISSYITGKVIREGVNLVIAGKPNSGKSSLFNYLLNHNRAIVSEIAGTTRDYIEENLILKGILFSLIDTAGLRDSDDEIESEGIKRSFKKIKDADLILYLIDSSTDENIIKEDEKYFKDNFYEEKSILIYSKSDLRNKNNFNNKNGVKIKPDKIEISLLKDESIETLKNEMLKKVAVSEINTSSNEIILTNLRHKICLEKVVTSLNEAIATIQTGMSGEFISVDLRNALKHLGEITGETTNDMILENIFRNFCIGK